MKFIKENFTEHKIEILECTGKLYLPKDGSDECWLITDCFLCKGDSIKLRGYSDSNINGIYEVVKSLPGLYKLEKVVD